MNLGFPLFPETASSLAPQVDAIYFFGLGIAAVFSLLIAVAILYLATKFKRRHPDEVGRPEKAAYWLEITWSLIPLGILLFMFAWGAVVFFEARRMPPDAVEYYVVAKRWMWKVQHPEGNREINTLHVPLGQKVKLVMTSEDVIHSFFVPAFRTKMDVLPGRYTELWFEATKEGIFDLFCAEYCGAEHSRMGGSIIVLPPTKYEEWLAGALQEREAPPSGEELFQAKACGTCHRADSSVQGPILHGIFGREEQMDDGERIVVDENYLRESILNPTARVVEGYNPLMPTYQGQLSEEELVQLILYIKSLTPTEAAGAASEGEATP